MRRAAPVVGVRRARGRRRRPWADSSRPLSTPARARHAYGRLSRHAGAVPPGVTADTVEALSLDTRERISAAVRSERSRWTPVRRRVIPQQAGPCRP